MDWEAFMDETVDTTAILAPEIPHTMAGFNRMGMAAKKDGELSSKTKELMALAIAVVTRCDSCIGYHVKALIRLETTRAELCEALAMIIFMGGGPCLTFSAKALQAYDVFSAKDGGDA